jgi:hypothetical protein
MQKQKVCDGCGKPSDYFHEHHVVPRSLGGIDYLTNIVTICEDCHNKIHSLKFTKHSELIKAGLSKNKEKAIKEGELWKCGRPPIAEEIKSQIINLRQEGLSLRAIEKSLNSTVTHTTIGKVIKGSIRQIAKQLNISKTTVERVIRGRR